MITIKLIELVKKVDEKNNVIYSAFLLRIFDDATSDNLDWKYELAQDELVTITQTNDYTAILQRESNNAMKSYLDQVKPPSPPIDVSKDKIYTFTIDPQTNAVTVT